MQHAMTNARCQTIDTCQHATAHEHDVQESGHPTVNSERDKCVARKQGAGECDCGQNQSGECMQC